MSRFWIFFLIYMRILPSSPVALSPCKVNNLQTQPLYGTSLRTREIVQIIQIPPVFTQNVLVGKCVNRNEHMASVSGQHFICSQRYSAVEVYVTDEEFYSKQFKLDPNSEETPAIQIFKKTNFIRDSVIVESGCDFTYNLLPFLLDQGKNNEDAVQRSANQENHFLKSPYHSAHPNTNASLLPSVVIDPSPSITYQHKDVSEQQYPDQGGNILTGDDEYKNPNPPYNGVAGEPESLQPFIPDVPSTSTVSKPASSPSHLKLNMEQSILWQRLQSHVNTEYKNSTQPSPAIPTYSPTSTGSYTAGDRAVKTSGGPIYTDSNPESSSIGQQVTRGENLLAGNTYEVLRERGDETGRGAEFGSEQFQYQPKPSPYQGGSYPESKPSSYSASGYNTTGPSPQTYLHESVPIHEGSAPKYPVVQNVSGPNSSSSGGIVSLSYPLVGNTPNYTNGSKPSEPLWTEGTRPENLLGGGKEEDLLYESQPVGLPLRILSRRFDTLKNNVDTDGTLL